MSSFSPTPERAPGVPSRVPEFSHRQQQLIGCVIQGLSNQEIAEQMGIRLQTVKNALNVIFARTGVRDRLELALFAIYHRLVEQRPVKRTRRAKTGAGIGER